MFSGDESIRFKSTAPKDQIASKIQTALNPIGTARVDSYGEIEIRTRQSLENFLTKTKLKGDVHESGGEYTVTVEYDCTLSTWGWVILAFGVLLYLLGLLVLLGPGLKKSDVAQIVRRSLRTLPDGGGGMF